MEQGVSENYIDVLVQGEVEWHLMGVYGEPRWDHKDKTCMAMRGLKGMMEKPWLALGDFNEILMGCEEGGCAAVTGLHGPVPAGAGGLFAGGLRLFR